MSTLTVGLQPMRDIPVPRQLASPGYPNNYHGVCFCSDGQRNIYFLYGYGQAMVERYDCMFDAFGRIDDTSLTTTTTPSSSSYNGDIIYDRSRACLFWIPGNGGTGFYRFDPASGKISSALTALPTAATYGCLAHTCTERNPAGNDDYIYYVSGGDRLLYRYSISGNSWLASSGSAWVATGSAANVVPAALSSGCNMFWLDDINPNYLGILRGSGTRTVYIVDVSNGSYVGFLNILCGGTITTGSISTYDNETGELYFIEGSQRRISKCKLNLTKGDVTGTATGGTTTTLIDTSKEMQTGVYAQMYFIRIVSGTGAGQVRKIVTNTDTTFTVNPAFSVAPDSTSVYEVKYSTLDYGTATSGGATTINDTAKAWFTSQFVGCKVRIIAGTSAGDERFITASTATQLTVSAAFTSTPDATSVYEILGLDTIGVAQAQLSTSASYLGNTMCIAKLNGLKFLYYWRKGSNGDWFRTPLLYP